MVAMLVTSAGAGRGHGFWVALGTFSVLRADLSTIGRSARAAVVGTAFGFVVSSAVVLAGERQEWVLWALLPVTMFLASFTGRFRPEVTATAFTTFLVTMYALADPDGLATAEARVVTVAIGAAVTLAVGAVLWPRVGSVRGATLAQVVAAAGARLHDAVATATVWAAMPDPEDGGGRSLLGEGAGWRSSLPVITELDRVLDTLATAHRPGRGPDARPPLPRPAGRRSARRCPSGCRSGRRCG
jgi:hypothetical protein